MRIVLLVSVFWISISSWGRHDFPTCVLSPSTGEMNLGSSLVLTLTSSGRVRLASIDGKSVGVPVGHLVVTPSVTGTFLSEGSVRNFLGEVGHCTARYSVKAR